ncbi:MAG: glycogen-debranching protein [Syntrophus sp. (in: bacteria)]|nr:glycogen-debranching protein [Syntrophus sp. (in: bacteria)]
MKKDWFATEGRSSPQGVTWIEDEGAYNFVLYSQHSTAVTLLLYGEHDVVHPLVQYWFDCQKNRSGRIWHCRIPLSAMGGAIYYAYKVEGPFDPVRGHRFDPEKILIDPYAKAVCFPPGFSREAARTPGSNAGKAPLGLIDPHRQPFDWGEDKRPYHTSDRVIYELHVRGFTMSPNSGINPDKRGTYAGLIEKIPYLKELGITTVELQPVFQNDPQEGSCWGYMPLNFFSPHNGYGSTQGDHSGQIDEFKTMVKAFHEADIDVILDVVYNHTTEGDEDGPTYSFRGIDNAEYYLLKEDKQLYRNDTGTGNVFNSSHPYVRMGITDSLSFWAREMHIDGFRFDLASIFTRDSAGGINLEDPPIITEIRIHPDLIDVDLIAEAWDLSTYQLGKSFPGLFWLQWNGQFRDDLRSFIRGDKGKTAALMTRLYGSNDLFPDEIDNMYHPYQSVNFITAHDGFCLYDLVAYNKKHNEGNGHHNTDGTDFNLSWNCGWEGDEGVSPEVMDLRKQQIRNFCALIFLSNGTPMIRAGDEFMNTQKGNNNPYNQDNEITWLNWDLLHANKDIFRFFKLMIAFRKAHPSLGRSRFWREDVRWHGLEDKADIGYDSHSLAFYLHGASESDDDIYIMINAYKEDLRFIVQEGAAREWLRVADTSLASPYDFAEPGEETGIKVLDYMVKAHSIVILRRPED